VLQNALRINKIEMNWSEKASKDLKVYLFSASMIDKPVQQHCSLAD
jgi:hypothetical protein